MPAWSLAILLAGLAIAVSLAIVLACVGGGAARWGRLARQLDASIDAARVRVEPCEYKSADLAGLPAPVQRFFRAALREGQPMVAAAHLSHSGEFNTDENGDKWAAFTSRQRVITRRPGFVWDARIRMAPGVTVFVHDAYAAGEGVLHAALFGLVTVAGQRGTPELAQGELMRFLAEAAWYPTALLPSQGVRWEVLDERSARASLSDGTTTVALDFDFGADGLIESARAAARHRMVGGKAVPTAWQGRFWDYEVREGMRLPMQGEVAWILDGGARPYWRGRIARVEYEFAG